MEPAVGRPRILIVDDEPATRDLLTDLLAAEGYRTESVAGGHEALVRAGQSPPDLIVLDVAMPDIDGFEVCRQLKADGRTAQVPILFITGLDDAAAKDEGLAAGADDYVTKPLEPTDLLIRIRSLLRVSHLSQELDRTLAYLQELELARRSASHAAAGRGWFQPPANQGAAHVLLVDDDRTIRQLYTGLIEGAGYRVTAVASAAEAYDAAARDMDAILLDIMMPGVSGLKALGRLRQIAPEVPVIIVTAYQSVQNAIAALRGGAFDFIIKGMKPEALLKTVARAVERHHLALENRRLLEELERRAGATLGAPQRTA